MNNNETPVTTAAIINAVVWQKDEVLRAINYSNDSDEVGRSRSMIELVAPLWQATGYGYKVAELFARLVARAEHLRGCELTYLDGCRKNDRTRGSTQKNIDRLTTMIGEMKSDTRGRKDLADMEAAAGCDLPAPNQPSLQTA